MYLFADLEPVSVSADDLIFCVVIGDAEVL